VHLPHWVENEWLKQFVAEQLVTVRTKRGFARLEWQKLRERNEALDCRVYARAAAWIAGADRWPDEKWRDLEDQLGAAPADSDPAGQINRPGQAPQGKRRSDWLGRREDGSEDDRLDGNRAFGAAPGLCQRHDARQL
jgi:phage terminase large subunit GpA-like protein